MDGTDPANGFAITCFLHATKEAHDAAKHDRNSTRMGRKQINVLSPTN